MFIEMLNAQINLHHFILSSFLFSDHSGLWLLRRMFKEVSFSIPCLVSVTVSMSVSLPPVEFWGIICMINETVGLVYLRMFDSCAEWYQHWRKEIKINDQLQTLVNCMNYNVLD